MNRLAIYGKACRALSVAAILIATIGVHIIHPLDGHHVRESAAAQCADFTPTAVPLVGEERAATVARAPLSCAEGGACPICQFLAAFHSCGPLEQDSVVSAGVTPDRLCLPSVATASTPGWLPYGARGPPPSSLL